MPPLSLTARRQIEDRFHQDAEALLDPAGIRTPAGIPATIGHLWGQILDARRRYVSIPVAVVANTTTRLGILAAARQETIVAINMAWGTLPASAAGTIVANVNKRVGATVTAVSGADFNLETHTANAVNAVALGTLAARRLATNEIVYIDIVSDNADATAGVGGVLTLVLEPTEE